MSDLLNKKCVPCEGGILPFDISEIHKYQKKVDGWDVKKNTREIYFLEKNFIFKNFINSQNFINKSLNIKEEVNSDKLKNSVNSTYFDKLKNDEKKNGFVEAVPSKKNEEKIPFFNLGPDNNWRKILDKDQKSKLKDIFKEDLMELGYE